MILVLSSLTAGIMPEWIVPVSEEVGILCARIVMIRLSGDSPATDGDGHNQGGVDVEGQTANGIFYTNRLKTCQLCLLRCFWDVTGSRWTAYRSWSVVDRWWDSRKFPISLDHHLLDKSGRRKNKRASRKNGKAFMSETHESLGILSRSAAWKTSRKFWLWASQWKN